MSKVINLFAPSGSGKSTGAAYIFSMLKMNGISCELIQEFAKDKVWENNTEIFKPENQVYIFGKQFYRMSRLKDKVDYIITDSPLLLSNVYNKSEFLKPHFEDAVRDCFNSFENLDWFIERVKPFDPKGRNEKSVEESDAYAEKIISELKKVNSQFLRTTGDQEGYDKIVKEILVLEGKL